MAKKASAKKTTSKSSRKFSLQSIADSRKNFTAFIVISLFIIGGLGFSASSFAASKAPKYLTICNHDRSYTSLLIYYGDVRDDNSSRRGVSKPVINGDCERLNNWYVRVDVDRKNRGVHSYKLGKKTQSGKVRWGKCHERSANGASNPPNNSPYGVMYRNYADHECGSPV